MGCLTRNAFRRLCRAIQVPMVIIGKDRYVEMSTFQIAMRAITRIGRPNFVLPSTESAYKPPDSVSSIKAEEVTENLRPILAELLAAHRTNPTEEMEKVRTSAQEAASRLARSGLHLMATKEQEASDKRMIKRLKDVDSRISTIMDDHGPERITPSNQGKSSTTSC